jgi:glycosyltransferase involved in cell wall biosynthesis
LHGKRVLVCGPVIEDGLVGGLQTALADLAAALATRGWHVDLAISPATLNLRSAPRREDLEGLSGARWSRLPRLHCLPPDLRTILQHLLLGGGGARVQSELLYALDTPIREGGYDAIIATVSREAPGLAHFVTERHPRVLLLSLNGLPSELRLRAWLHAPRLLARIVSRRRFHPDLYRGVDPRRIRMAAFASDTWYEEALRAGLPATAGRVIYFGLPHVPPLVPAAPAGNRLLWVGRLTPEKGLHHFIEAVALLRRTRPVTLTAICGPGPDHYRRGIVRRISELDLAQAVHLRPAVPRAELTHAYRTHDALLFQSPFAEPVALVLLEAFAAGVPVIAPWPRRQRRLVKPDETCVCFRSATARDIASAAERLLDGRELRDHVRRNAHGAVRAEFTMCATAAAFDAALRTLLHDQPVPV